MEQFLQKRQEKCLSFPIYFPSFWYNELIPYHVLKFSVRFLKYYNELKHI